MNVSRSLRAINRRGLTREATYTLFLRVRIIVKFKKAIMQAASRLLSLAFFLQHLHARARAHARRDRDAESRGGDRERVAGCQRRVKNSPIKKISFLPVTRGGAQLMSDAKMIYGAWERERRVARGRLGRAYHKLMNYQRARVRESEKVHLRARADEQIARAIYARQCAA